MDRLRTEKEFHDRQARQRAATFHRRRQNLRFADDDYLRHETWIEPAFERLGRIGGRRVLDFGCGHGMAAVVLARRGARVTALDLSGGYLAEARDRAEANGVVIDFVQADGERLPFADAGFDAVWGNAVLHHLDLRRAGGELHRILRPNGIAVFCEPWGENPLLNLARKSLPYPGKNRTPDESPIRKADVETLKEFFSAVEVRGYQCLSMLRRLCPISIVTRSFQRGDELLLSRFPRLQKYCRYVVITLRRQ